MSDTAAISSWASIRLAVGSAMFITYAIFYAAYHFASFKQHDKPKVYVQITNLASKMYLFGVGCLLSLNYSQASIYQAIFTYFTMAAVIFVIVLTMIESSSDKLKVGANIVFYLLLVMWYMGIIIDYYKTLSSNWGVDFLY